MAYPGEHKNVRYYDYAIEESTAGRKPKTKSEWSAAQKAAAAKKKQKPKS